MIFNVPKSNFQIFSLGLYMHFKLPLDHEKTLATVPLYWFLFLQ